MKILLCTDGSEQSKKVVTETVKIANGCSAQEVDVIHAYTMAVFPRGGYPASQTAPIVNPVVNAEVNPVNEHIQRINQETEERGKLILSETAELFADTNITVNTILEVGHAAEAIINRVENGQYDLVVVGSRGLGGLKKAFLGSVSNAVLQEVNVSVLVVK